MSSSEPIYGTIDSTIRDYDVIVRGAVIGITDNMYRVHIPKLLAILSERNSFSNIHPKRVEEVCKILGIPLPLKWQSIIDTRKKRDEAREASRMKKLHLVQLRMGITDAEVIYNKLSSIDLDDEEAEVFRKRLISPLKERFKL